VGNQEYVLLKLSSESNTPKETKLKSEDDYIKAIYGGSKAEDDNQSMANVSVGQASVPDFHRVPSFPAPMQAQKSETQGGQSRAGMQMGADHKSVTSKQVTFGDQSET